MKYPMHPLAQAGAPSSNARSPELGGRAKPQLPPPQPPRHHLPLRPLPSRRRVRNYPRGHSGDQTPTYNLLFAAPRPRRLSCSRLPVRDSLGPEHLRHRERHGIERSCTLVDPGCTHTRFLCRFCKKFCELCFFDTRSTVACSLGVTNSKYVLQLFS